VKAPPFTRANAAEMAMRSNAAQRARREEHERLTAQAARVTTDDARRTRTLKQLDLLDGLIDDALAKKNTTLFLRLSAAKERLWKLVQPTAGVLKPGKAGGSVRRALTPPLSVDPPEPTA
jgi:hypothetical protein